MQDAAPWRASEGLSSGISSLSGERLLVSHIMFLFLFASNRAPPAPQSRFSVPQLETLPPVVGLFLYFLYWRGQDL